MNAIESILRDRFRNYPAVKKDLCEMETREERKVFVGLLCMADENGIVGGNTSDHWINRLNAVAEKDWNNYLNSLEFS